MTRIPAMVLITLLCMAAATPAEAEYRKHVKAVFGLTQLGDDTIDVDAPSLSPIAGASDADFGGGFGAGFAFGWTLSDEWLLEGEYLYQTNDNDRIVLPDASVVEEGNFASVVISANAYYLFGDSERSLRPYVGAGLGWVQEVDIDFETGGEEIEFETDDAGFQLMGGLRWKVAKRWDLDFQARYFDAGRVKMTSSAGTVRADYAPLSLQANVAFRF